jgi:hypothetical protein
MDFTAPMISCRDKLTLMAFNIGNSFPLFLFEGENILERPYHFWKLRASTLDTASVNRRLNRGADYVKYLVPPRKRRRERRNQPPRFCGG